MRLFPVVVPTIQNLNQFDPVRIQEADRNRISLSSFPAMPFVLGNKLAYTMVHFTFYIELDCHSYAELSARTRLKFLVVYEPNLYDFGFLISGSLTDWLETIKEVCKDKSQCNKVRFMFNVINNYFVTLGLKEFQVIDCKDGTYIVKELN